MVGIASKCSVGLGVARHHTCEGTESGGGFSPGYVLLSFQNLTPSSSQIRLTTLKWTKVMPTPCMQNEKNPPYKGGWLKIGLSRREGTNQNTQTLINYQLAPSTTSIPIEWDKEAVHIMSIFGYWWYWPPRSGCRQGQRWEKPSPLRDIMLNNRGERMTKALGRTGEDGQTPGIKKTETSGSYRAQAIPLPHDVNSPSYMLL